MNDEKFYKLMAVYALFLGFLLGVATGQKFL